MIKLLEILILIIPAVSYALWNGRNGVKHPAYKQVITVGVIIGLCQLFQFFFVHHDYFLSTYLKGCLVSITGYGLFFPYMFNWIWGIKAVFWSKEPFIDKLNYVLQRLSSTAIPDRYFIKYNVHWLVRLLIYVTLFVL